MTIVILERFFQFLQPKNSSQPELHKPYHPRLDQQGQWVDEDPRLVVLSGSGISVASGVPTYRSDNGLWLNYSLDNVCNLSTWKDNKHDIQKFYQMLWDQKQNCLPNMGHLILDSLDCVHYTQNVDGLASNAIPIHGQLKLLECLQCGCHWPHNGVIDLSQKCPDCHTFGEVKPGVVFFHQYPPMYQVFLNTLSGLRETDVLVVVGTSGAVVPIVAWVRSMGVQCQKWLFNYEGSPELPSEFFDCVMMGPFEQTCFGLKDKWQQHKHNLKSTSSS